MQNKNNRPGKKKSAAPEETTPDPGGITPAPKGAVRVNNGNGRPDEQAEDSDSDHPPASQATPSSPARKQVSPPKTAAAGGQPGGGTPLPATGRVLARTPVVASPAQRTVPPRPSPAVAEVYAPARDADGFDLPTPDPTDEIPGGRLSEEDYRDAELPVTNPIAQDGLSIQQRIVQNHQTLATITDSNGFRPRNPTPYVANADIANKTAIASLSTLYRLHEQPTVMVDITKLDLWETQREVRPPTVRRLYNRIKVSFKFVAVVGLCHH